VALRAYQNIYYLAVQHRNHLGVMNAIPAQLSESGATVLDFTQLGFNTFGSNSRVQLPSGNMALWAGDANTNKSIRFSGSNNDTNVVKDYILADPVNFFNSATFSSTGYLDIDINMDGIGRFSGAGNDSNLIKDNVLAHPGNGFNNVTFIIPATVPDSN
ncbi:MAG: hemagglutinin protein, partial [Bacteroidia bacterium]|nr:hemagglutinin protein [Bacteroidia bacterium]